ncbi:MAG: DUF523 domain-containing protein [Lachnospiraceae bacterium]|nr:DUF523 domain-containing protein [Lachnospiraceae bacterium]
MEAILVSACLLGVHCRYDGTGVLQEHMEELREKYQLIPVCPEIYGGLATPRDAAERADDRVMTCKGTDVTAEYQRGAEEILRLAKFYDCKLAVLKERSPSCGSGYIYDGTFSGEKIEGDGVTAALLKAKGIRVLGESMLDTLL